MPDVNRAVGAREQMTARDILITRCAKIPEPELRTLIDHLVRHRTVDTVRNEQGVLASVSPKPRRRNSNW